MTAGPAVLAVDLGPGIRAGFTVAGAGQAPPNLSLVVGDADDGAVNRLALERWLGGPPVYLHQVHGADVHLATAPTHEPWPSADAVVSAAGVGVAVLVADCVPVLLADAVVGVVGAVHAGRRGVVAGVVAEAVRAMVGLGAQPQRLRAVIGPAICGACYEVPAALRTEVASVVPESAATTSWGTPALDLPRAVAHQLASVGVLQVTKVGGCTREDARWFSHRGMTDGRPPGRLAGVVRATPGAIPGT